MSVSKTLKTSCNNCIFKSNNESGCAIYKPTFTSTDENGNITQFVEGFCMFKRNEAWKTKEGLETKNLFTVKRTILDEESKLSLIIINDDTDTKKVEETLESIYPVSNIFNDLTIVTDMGDIPIKNWRNIVNKYYNGLWRLEQLTNDAKEYDFYEKLDYVSMMVSSNWFMACQSGEILDWFEVDKAKRSILDLGQLVSVYFHDKCFIVNKFAFKDLGGSVDTNFLSKLDIFENKENVCPNVKSLKSVL